VIRLLVIRRLYVHNFRCLENFELPISGRSSALLIGTNGSGKTFDKILGTVKPLKTWAKYGVPANVKKVTVVITGVEPFERVAIGELQPDST